MSKRQEIREKRLRQQRQQKVIIIIMVVIGALLVVSAMIYPTLKPVGDFVQITPKAITAPIDMNIIGNKDARVQVDVWEDFQCPACRNFSQQIEPAIFSNYVETGKIVYTYHHYAFIDSQVTSKESQQSANASMCAGAQGRFWDMHDIIFANWNGENQGAYSDKRLVAFADTLGLDMKEFNSCFDQNQYKAEIDKDYLEGSDWGVTGTPTIFVNGVKVGDKYIPTYEEIAAAIEAELVK